MSPQTSFISKNFCSVFQFQKESVLNFHKVKQYVSKNESFAWYRFWGCLDDNEIRKTCSHRKVETLTKLGPLPKLNLKSYWWTKAMLLRVFPIIIFKISATKLIHFFILKFINWQVICIRRFVCYFVCFYIKKFLKEFFSRNQLSFIFEKWTFKATEKNLEVYEK